MKMTNLPALMVLLAVFFLGFEAYAQATLPFGFHMGMKLGKRVENPVSKNALDLIKAENPTQFRDILALIRDDLDKQNQNMTPVLHKLVEFAHLSSVQLASLLSDIDSDFLKFSSAKKQRMAKDLFVQYADRILATGRLCSSALSRSNQDKELEQACFQVALPEIKRFEKFTHDLGSCHTLSALDKAHCFRKQAFLNPNYDTGKRTEIRSALLEIETQTQVLAKLSRAIPPVEISKQALSTGR